MTESQVTKPLARDQIYLKRQFEVLVHLGISGPGGASITDIAEGDLREGLCPGGAQ